MTEALDRIAIVSDIHGNLQALTAVLDDIDRREIDAIYSCGDIVGYGGNPNECVALFRQRGILTVIGNHDVAALGLADISNFNDVALKAILWTKNVLSLEHQKFLKRQPLRMSFGDIVFVHASPFHPENWNYILTVGEARSNFDFFDEQICCIGHSHQPFIIERNGDELACPADPSINIQADAKYLINVGSVGQPRDHNPNASYGVYDRAAKRLEIVRVLYDVDAAQRAITDQGLPQVLALRLAAGS